ncbi:prepilin-type N-terminal cleavage/methylation domain-containing protein [Vibrio metschnikovii]|uniref:MSHA biogenesis protein MshO n=1 Tax=Vibrio cincinnatiensis DSM 19608 TaxID=1123491 RepID=A0A1T4QFH0_VIBCI|nr:prepilin-type N-terminal cleavage/methylation domain-containing protein [Vibrio cincinnatiensis]EKO3610542.1 prepilin-type N-terminal cleavage/methylation domain-containing protein [Vibrio metschnikovii]EKO3621589.1 prepilin-type N-terminal cleavage/methylation domain-containing protein [Vibrio metschnikovii]EKO3622633.1 prepilin-type N-terminal cleavage/methylation domain-containing protein [Vibrio metschnikovii]EKO3624715.1 prepilin-type N-terminal cleavage/methylation domain-containing pr
MKKKGFTLIEMVLTMIVGSILVLAIAGFVELGSKGYVDTVNRQRLQTQAKFVLEKITREIRHAVPNSISLESGGNCLSFFPIVYSGYYALDDADDKKLEFIVGNSKEPNINFSGLNMVINPSSQDDLTGANRAIPSLAGSSTTLTLNRPLDSQSVANRFYIYQDKVTYCKQGTTVSRQQANGEYVKVTDNIESAAFDYDQPTLQRGGIVHLALTFSQNGESSHFEQDAQVLNVP